MFTLIAGHVALDFVNTLDNRYLPGKSFDLLATYPDFLHFCQEAGTINRQQAGHLSLLGQEAPSALENVIELREALERIFMAVSESAPTNPADLACLSAAVEDAMIHRVLIETGGRIEWSWDKLDDDPLGPLWPIAEAAANLLVSELVGRVRQCGSETCRWLFLDTSKNHSRRWCDMKLCGNRIKARNYYQRGRREHLTE